MTEYRECLVCGKSFLPSKYRKDQRICSQLECQHQRQLRNLAVWRQRNPGYFKISRHDTSWAAFSRRRAQIWRKRHTRKIKKYKAAHKTEQREYMREYMYRLRHSHSI
ncbi:MAG: hypothetical protein V1662_06160 [Candidatus Omnitrophota bacterium]